MVLSPALKCWGPTRRQGLYSQSAHLWAHCDFVPCFEALGTPEGRGYVANLPTCAPILILSPASKLRGSPRKQGLCSQSVYVWATANLDPQLVVVLATPKTIGVM